MGSGRQIFYIQFIRRRIGFQEVPQRYNGGKYL